MNLRRIFHSVSATSKYPEYLSLCPMLQVMNFFKKVVVNDIKTHLRDSAPNKLTEILRVIVLTRQKVQASQCEGTFDYISYTSKVLSMKVLENY